MVWRRLLWLTPGSLANCFNRFNRFNRFKETCGVKMAVPA
jgi:hypothetical protein